MDADAAVDRLRAMIRVPTVSRAESGLQDADAFARFPALLAELYPRTHAALDSERVGEFGLLYRWPGREPGAAMILMAHWDVVPADEEGWTHDAFAAHLSTDPDGARRLWGRGAIDDKGALAAILDAVEQLVVEGFAPARDVYLSFGGDEEVQGASARAAVDVLHGRGIAVDLVLDEGGAVVQGQFPGVAAPTAVIGIAEKGIATIELRATEAGGHAAHPPRDHPTATQRLARAIERVSRQPPAGLPPTVFPMFAAVGAHARGVIGFALRHPRLMRPVLLRALAGGSDETNALVRTTRVVTRLRGAAADNVLPEVATATVNMRIVVGSSLDAEVARIRRDIDDPRIEVRVIDGGEPSPVASVDGPAWERLVAALSASHPDAIPVPYAMLGATDGRHFARLTDSVYRFTPFALSARELAGLHAIDESIRVEEYVRGIAFYRALLQSA